MIRDTFSWETRRCGCNLQLSIYEDELGETPPMEMWVIREPCERHRKKFQEYERILEMYANGDISLEE